MRPAAAADPASFLDPFDDRVLLDYYHEIARWHGYIRFLGLPHLRDNPDVPIDRLYVEPSTSASRISPEQPTKDWAETAPVLQTVAESQRLVLLGDPGSGKSTLVSWIAWQLTQPGDNAWTKRLGRIVPIPMVLRDMKLGSDLTWDALLSAFLALPVAKALDADGKGFARLRDLFERGQAILMLDGLDEIGATAVRTALQAAVFEGFRRCEQCRWLLTSRIVGYDVVPFDTLDIKVRQPGMDPGEAEQLTGSVLGLAAIAYVAPFSDKQIDQFAHHWYVQHEQSEHERKQRAADLLEAIASNEGTRQLARIPNLLTLIALIYRVSRWLPHGRALLYDRIAEAYLESIDRFRGLDGLNYPLAQKKRWLAFVGFQMQSRRASQSSDSDRDILVDEDQVHSWIAEAMGGSAEDAEAAARKFVDYIARRSGLLLPRGDGQFAFTHLSLQEYFAACHLVEQVMAPRWLDGGARNPSVTSADVRAFANDVNWKETLILVFELLAEQRGWPDYLVECIYGEDFGELVGDPERRKKNAALLLAELHLDRHGGLSADCREKALMVCWYWELVAQQSEGYSKSIPHNELIRALCLHSRREFADIWIAFKKALQWKGDLGALQTLDLWHAEITDSDLRHLADLTSLRALDLHDATLSCVGVAQISAMHELEILSLSGTLVADEGLASLAEIKTLKSLNLYQCMKITDAGLANIAGLEAIETLYLSDTKITDAGLSHIARLEALETLNLSDTKITDAGLAHLSHCTKLVNLYTDGTEVTEEGKERFFESLRRQR